MTEQCAVLSFSEKIGTLKSQKTTVPDTVCELHTYVHAYVCMHIQYNMTNYSTSQMQDNKCTHFFPCTRLASD